MIGNVRNVLVHRFAGQHEVTVTTGVDSCWRTGHCHTTQRTENRLLLNQWLAASQFPFLWDCVTVNGFCPHKRKFLFLVLCVRVCGGKAINCVPAHAQRTFLFSFLGPALDVSLTFPSVICRSREREEKEMLCGNQLLGWQTTGREKEKGNVIRSSVPTAASFSFSFCYWPAMIICVIRPIKKNRKRRNEWTGKGMPTWPQSTFLS